LHAVCLLLNICASALTTFTFQLDQQPLNHLR
jgi:hypothetical protein